MTKQMTEKDLNNIYEVLLATKDYRLLLKILDDVSENEDLKNQVEEIKKKIPEEIVKDVKDGKSTWGDEYAAMLMGEAI